MKSIITTCAVIFLALILPSIGCKKSNSNTETEPAVTTPAQTEAMPAAAPAGPATRATIGASGGALKSADGRIEITIPPAALFADIQVSIQPVSATDLDCVGPVYQLSPEGSSFAQPVTLAWHLSDSDLAGQPLTALIIATRDENGGWRRQPGVEHDPASKIVRVTTSHFSQWGLGWSASLPDLNIVPDQAEVNVKGSITLKAEVTKTKPPVPPASGKGVSDDELLTGPAPTTASSDDDLLTVPFIWKVNGVVGGNDKWGTIRKEADHDAVYTAPAKLPPKNPVTVSSETSGKPAKIIATSLITVTEKKGWIANVSYKYHEEHSSTGLTVAGEPATSWGTADRTFGGAINLYADPRFGGMAVGGAGASNIRVTQSSGMKNNMCNTEDETLISGRVAMEAQGLVGSGAGSLSVTIHGENLEGTQTPSGSCRTSGQKVVRKWNTAEFGTSCNFVGVDYDKGGIFETDVPSDQGHGKCKVTIIPQ
jgi:hypothetical protein